MTPRIGSISSGTLNPFDLFSAFLDAARDVEADQDRVDDILSFTVQELTDFLADHAPPYTYFGSHEGDGADFGFWPLMDEIGELPRLNSGPMSYYDQARALGEDCWFVNDHGNVTVYSSTGEIILEIV